MTVRHETAGELEPHRADSAASRLGARAAGLAARLTRYEEGRGFLWWPVGLAVGIGVYFALPFEPDWRLAVPAVLACLAAVLWARRRATGTHIASLVLLALTIGFAAASLRTIRWPRR